MSVSNIEAFACIIQAIVLIDFLKELDGYAHEFYQVTLTRQQIADLTNEGNNQNTFACCS